jgi:hypothetical protein
MNEEGSLAMHKFKVFGPPTEATVDMERLLEELRSGEVLDRDLDRAVNKTLDGFQAEYRRLIKRADEKASSNDR